MDDTFDAESDVFLKTFRLLYQKQAVCSEASIFTLREGRVHMTQEGFETALAKIMKKDVDKNMTIRKLWK